MRHVSLFAGVDAMGIAAEHLGYQTTLACEIEEFQRQILALRHPHAELAEDVRDLRGADLGRVDLMTGGFPCQDLSSAGRGAGLSGARSGLWSEFARLIAEAQPKVVLIENVAVLRSRGLDIVINDLACIGYGCWWDVVPALAVGAPHLRERVWITAVHYEDMPDLEGKPLKSITTKMPRSGASTTRGIIEMEPQATQKACKAAVGAVKREDGTTWLTKIDMPLLPASVAADDNKSPEAHMKMKANLKGGPRRQITSLGVLARNGFNSAAGQPMFPTPERSDGTGGRVSAEMGGQRPSGAKRAVTLATRVAHLEPQGEDQRLWPTAAARDWKSGASNQHDKNSRPLNEVVDLVERTQMFPTPRSSDGERGGRGDLIQVVRGNKINSGRGEQSLWPTPRASANELRTTKSAPSHGNGHGTVLSGVVCDRERVEGREPPKGTQSAGPLNPDWVEWLMGWPIGLTDLECEQPVQLDWLSEYGIPRVARDVPNRKQRLMAIGNGLVWQVAWHRLVQAHALLGLKGCSIPCP